MRRTTMSDMFISKPSQVITQTIQFTEYNLYLHGEIGGPDDFMEHFAVYKMANEGDIVRLYINSQGGSLATGMEYIRHMRECEAKIIAVLGVEVASMASAIALEADEIELDELSTLLIHSISYGTGGPESSVYSQALFNNKLNERWIRSTYKDFLEEDEFADVFKGVDIMLDADQIMEKWNKRERVRSGACECEQCSCELEEDGDVYLPDYAEADEEDGQVVEVVEGQITNSRKVDGKVRMSVEVSEEVFARIKDKTLQIVVDME